MDLIIEVIKLVKGFLRFLWNSFLIFIENATFFLDRYENKYTPMEAFFEFEEGDEAIIRVKNNLKIFLQNA